SESSACGNLWQDMASEANMRRRFFRALICLLSVTGSVCVAAPATAPATQPITLYDPNPDHLWNRLHAALLVRTAPSGQQFGQDTVDPILWANTKHLLVGPSHDRAIAVLKEFIDQHGEKLIADPIKRAILQRDLWAVFD